MDAAIRQSVLMGQQLKSLRKHRGLSQGELGAMVGVSQTRIAQIEAQAGTVSFDQILHLLQLLGADLVVRVDDNGKPPPARQPRGDAPAKISAKGRAGGLPSRGAGGAAPPPAAAAATHSVLFRPKARGSW